MIKPGMLGVFDLDPELEPILRNLAQLLLRRSPINYLSIGERELVATYVSALNQTNFCLRSHGAVAEQLGIPKVLVQSAQSCELPAYLSARLKAVLQVAKWVVDNDLSVLPNMGLAQADITEIVEIAAAFCFFNRLVKYLSPVEPSNESDYWTIASELATRGYSG